MPAEKFNNNVWYILRKIREKSFYSPKKGFVSYEIYDPIPENFISESCPSFKEEMLILEKLDGWRAIKLHRPSENEMFESIEILQPKFDEIYNKFKNHFFPPKKVIPDETIKRLKIPPFDEGEKLMSGLYKAAKKSQHSHKVYIGGLDDVDEKMVKILGDLGKRKIITYKTKERVVNSYTENGDIIPYEIIEAEIKFNPEKLINYIKKPLETKKIIVEKLARYYLDLIRVIEVYFKNPQKLDDALNKSYEILCEEIRVLIYENNISSRLEFLYKKPFNSLFSAERELKKKKITLKDKINSLRDFYGEIQKLLLIYSVDDKQNDEISKIENHLNKIESEGKMKKNIEKFKKDSNWGNTQEENNTSNDKNKGIMPIKIVGMPELQIKGFEEKVVLQKPKNKKIQIRKFPAGLKWEEISIQFLNEHEVIIKAKDETLQTTYETMGFQDEKKKLPNKQWQFLQLLALKNGEVSWENNQNLSLKLINSIKKKKQLLTEALKAYFQIYDNEPFWDYKTEKAYRIKITLTPEPGLKDINKQKVYEE